ncbi:MAG: CPBP family intramembrane metalloprotease [Actinobacteria bacterium]|nr:CPBP family intramembrane metalloprotease [Actinomycetota bacterium]MCL6088527.1 CPBP family intramembrane metalloprotease [Actinomycetota bacterium]
MDELKRSKLKRIIPLEEKGNEDELRHIKWTLRDILFSLLFLIAVLAAVYFGTAKIVSVLKIAERINSSNITNFSFLILYGIQVLLMVGVVWFFAIYWRRASFKDLGLKYYSIIKTIWYSFLALLLIILINFAYVFIMTRVFNIAPSASKIEELAKNKNVSSTMLMIVVSVVAPVCEEIFFRGFLFQGFRKKWGTFAGILISSFLFAAAHLDLYNFLPLMAIGWILAYIFFKTKSLFPVIFLHATYNLLMILVLFSQLNLIRTK